MRLGQSVARGEPPGFVRTSIEVAADAEALIVYVTAPAEAAVGLARALVEDGHAACVNVLPGVTSVYRWQDSLHEDQETLLIAKTTADAFEGLAARVRAMHPYEVPEIVAVPITHGDPRYLSWLSAQTGVPA